MASNKFIAIVFTVLFVALEVSATTFQPMPLERLIEESNRAAEVELKSKKSFMNKIGMIMTEFTFSVGESYNLDTSDLDGEYLKITMTGGTVNGVTSFIDGAPEFAVGEKSFLLLKKIESKIYLSNFTMGKYKIKEQDGKVVYVSTVFPADAELGQVEKEKMIDLVKTKFKISDVSKIKVQSEKKVTSVFKMPNEEKREPAQLIEPMEKSSQEGAPAMWAFFVLFSISGVTIWWKLRKGVSV